MYMFCNLIPSSSYYEGTISVKSNTTLHSHLLHELPLCPLCDCTARSILALFKPVFVGSSVVSCPAGKIGGKIRLVTLRTILDTRSNFHTFRQEFETANRNTAFFNHCNSEDGSAKMDSKVLVPRLSHEFHESVVELAILEAFQKLGYAIQVKIRRLLSATLYWGVMPLSCYQRGA